MSNQQTVMLSLDTVSEDDPNQPRVKGLDKKHVRLLAEAGPENLPPPVVTPNDEGGYDTVAGHHTIAAARLNGLKELRCIVDESAGPQEAFASNLLHGLPPSMEDRKAYVRWLKVHEPSLSFREIGRRTALSDKTVAATLRAGHSTKRPRTEPDSVARFVGYLLRTHGSNKPNARAIRREIDAYENESRSDVAAALSAIGSVLVEASSPYLEGR